MRSPGCEARQTSPAARAPRSSWARERQRATVKNLGSTGARHSIHGDVLHSRPVAINYGNEGVVVYYGVNDGFLRAIDGREDRERPEATSCGRSSRPSITRCSRGNAAGTPLLHLPETDSDGTLERPLLNGGTPRSTPSTVRSARTFFTTRRGHGEGGDDLRVDAPRRKLGVRLRRDEPVHSVFKWKIESGQTASSDLAQTWSMPKPIVYKSTIGDAAGRRHDGRRL